MAGVRLCMKANVVLQAEKNNVNRFYLQSFLGRVGRVPQGMIGYEYVS